MVFGLISFCEFPHDSLKTTPLRHAASCRPTRAHEDQILAGDFADATFSTSSCLFEAPSIGTEYVLSRIG